MNISNALSDAILAITAIWVFWTRFHWMSRYERLLWGFFFMTISLAALAGTVRFLGMQFIQPLHHSLEVLAGSLGVVCLVVAVYGLVLNRPVGQRGFMATLLIGLGLFFALLLSPLVGGFGPVVQSLAMVIVLLTACLGLMRRSARAVWIVFGIMILAVATKLLGSPGVSLPINRIDFYHYSLTLMLLCLGKAGQPAPRK